MSNCYNVTRALQTLVTVISQTKHAGNYLVFCLTINSQNVSDTSDDVATE